MQGVAQPNIKIVSDRFVGIGYYGLSGGVAGRYQWPDFSQHKATPPDSESFHDTYLLSLVAAKPLLGQ